jgi:hypothetical protein
MVFLPLFGIDPASDFHPSIHPFIHIHFHHHPFQRLRQVQLGFFDKKKKDGIRMNDERERERNAPLSSPLSLLLLLVTHIVVVVGHYAAVAS